MADETKKMDRRGFLKAATRALAGLGLGVGVGAVVAKGDRDDLVWQIDPEKCIACGNCATACVLTPSAVRAVHDMEVCGFCDFCFGYFAEVRPGDEETAENVRCPTNAIIRSFVEEPYYEYLIDEPKCIGCAACVEGCQQYGNGALVMQVRHDRCLNCNECAIAAQCPADAFVRVPADDPYLLPSSRLQEEADEDATEETPPAPQPEPAPQPRQPTRPEDQPSATDAQEQPSSPPEPSPDSEQPPDAPADETASDSFSDLLGVDHL